MILRVAAHHVSSSTPKFKPGEALMADEVASVVAEEARTLRAHTAQCKAFAPLYERAAKALRLPILSTYADRMRKRASEIDGYLPLHKSLPALCDKLDNELFAWIKTANPEMGDAEILGVVRALPSFDKLVQLANQLNTQVETWEKEDEFGYLDTTLESYISEETGLAKRLMKTQFSSQITGDHDFASTVFGYLNYAYDPSIREYMGEEP